MKTRNPNGTGTIIKRSDGRYEWRQIVDGKTRYIYAKTLSELNQKKNVVAAKPITKEITLDTWVQRWLETYVKPLRAPATYDQYRILYDKHVKPEIGQMKLNSVKGYDIVKIIANMHKEGLSASTMTHVRKILHIAFKAALKDKLIPENPVQDIAIPSKQSKQKIVLSVEEITRLLIVMEKSRWLPSVKFALTTGVRRGELLSLQWGDIDGDKITVRRSLSEYGTGETKSRKARYIPMSESTKQIIAEQRDLLEREFNPSILRNMNKLVFPSERGTAVTPRVYLNAIKYYAKKADITATVHCFRHTYVYLTRNILTLKELQNSLGHERSTTTLDIYGDMLDNLSDTGKKIDTVYEALTKK
jgi:integrase